MELNDAPLPKPRDKNDDDLFAFLISNKSFSDFFLNFWPDAIVGTLTAIAAISQLFASDPILGAVFRTVSIAACVSAVIFLVITAVFRQKIHASIDKKTEQVDELKRELCLQKEISERFEHSVSETKSLLDAMYEVLKNCGAQNEQFEIDIFSNYIVNSIYKYLSVEHNHRFFSVSIYERKGKTVKMIAHACESVKISKPRIFDVLFSKATAKQYYWGKIFFEWSSSLYVLENNTRINEKFYFSDVETTSKSRYSQYIGIPVYCGNRSRNSRPEYLIEVIAFEDHIIAQGKDGLESYAKHFLDIFAQILRFIATYNNLWENDATEKKNGKTSVSAQATQGLAKVHIIAKQGGEASESAKI